MSRQEFIDAVKAQAFDVGRPCEHCGGEGTVHPGRRIVHCRGSFTGADWDEAAVVAAIEEATEVTWIDLPSSDHQLAVLLDGKAWRFQVRRPDLAEDHSGRRTA